MHYGSNAATNLIARQSSKLLGSLILVFERRIGRKAYHVLSLSVADEKRSGVDAPTHAPRKFCVHQMSGFASMTP